ncbi:hypothetical protein ACHWQZ_G005336 [Mnemiopsis leidyi]
MLQYPTFLLFTQLHLHRQLWLPILLLGSDSTPTSDPAPPSTDSAPPSDPAPPAYSPPSDPAPPAYTPADPATVPAPPAYSALNRPPARTFSLCGLINEYDRVVAKVNQQMTLYAALESEGLSPSFFFRKRCVAEAAKVDRPTLESGMNQLRKVTLKGVFPIAKDICNRRLNDLRTLATSGAVLQPKGSFLTECTNNKRDHHTLLRLIKQNVLPGTIILTDKWKGYNSLSHHGFIHLVVNHRQGFVDPLTGVHTNTCEGMWFHAKKHMRQGHGRTRVDSTAVSIALCEFVWLKKFGLTRSDSSIRQMFNRDIPQLMSRVFS